MRSVNKISYSIGLGNLDEFSDSERVVWVLVWMLDKTELPVGSLDYCLFSAWVNSQYLVGVKGLHRLDPAYLVCCQIPERPEEYCNCEFEKEAWLHPWVFVCQLSLLDRVFAPRALTVLSVELKLLLSKYHNLEDVVGEGNQEDCQDWDEKVVEGWVIIVKKLLLLPVKIVLRARHIKEPNQLLI